jgi:hypothetical protein
MKDANGFILERLRADKSGLGSFARSVAREPAPLSKAGLTKADIDRMLAKRGIAVHKMEKQKVKEHCYVRHGLGREGERYISNFQRTYYNFRWEIGMLMRGMHPDVLAAACCVSDMKWYREVRNLLERGLDVRGWSQSGCEVVKRDTPDDHGPVVEPDKQDAKVDAAPTDEEAADDLCPWEGRPAPLAGSSPLA